MLLTIIAFIVTIGIIVIVHEFGHFLAARLTGMAVKKFSIGFPPKLMSRMIGKTEFSIGWIPLGGYVQIAGMVDESLDGSGITGAPDEFMSKNLFQKVFALSAGVLLNYLTAFLIISGLAAVLGIGEPAGTRVGDVLEDMPAQTAGIVAGDEIIAINGQEVDSWSSLVAVVGTARDTVHFVLKRTTGLKEAISLPTQDAGDGTGRRVVGIVPEIVRRAATTLEIVERGWDFCRLTTVGIIRFLRGLASGASSLSDLSGPLGVAQLSGESARQGSGTFLYFLAYVSVSIGFLNILPLPVLDGGHIVYVLIEAIIRRPIPTKIKLWVQQIGMALLILLVLFVSYHDVIRIFSR